MDKAPDSHARRARITALAVAFAFTLAACGGGGGGGSTPAAPPPAPPPETLYVPANAWRGGVPADAEAISADEFRRRQAAGELQLITPDAQQTQRGTRAQQVAADRAFLEAQTDLSAEVTALLAQARAANDLEGEPVATLSNGQKVGLIDLGSRIEKAAADYRLARDSVNALASYELSYGLLGDALKAQVPAPATLRGATLAQLRQATAQMDAVLATQVNLDNARLDPDAPVTSPVRPLNAGNGVDNGGACSPTGFVRRYWFPLRGFVSPVKDQGERGTCWAFAAIAAVESRERVQFNNAADLSEQFLVNKVKREWYENDFVDGGSSANALNAAVDRNQALLSEAGWTYNPARGRPDNAFNGGVAGTSASYAGACTGYTGFCSETAHQTRRSCTTVLGFDFCGYNKVAFNGPGVPASRVRQIWNSGQTFNLNQYRALLASGVSIIASFPVYEGIMAAPATGIVSDYSMTMRNAAGDLVNGSYGGHLVQIVGFLSNEELSFPGSPVNVGGGGYFIVRNSWGCAADGGYYYVPADYVSTRFSTLEILDFDATRSARWNAEQVTPGGTSGLAIDPQGTAVVDLRVIGDLAGRFAITHPVANYVRLTVTSNRDGLLFDGQWLVNPPVGGSLFGNNLRVNLQTEGLRTLTLTARYGSQVVSATKDVIVLNSAPTVRFETSGTPRQGENFVVNAVVSDANESDLTGLCNAMTWTVTAPDTIVSGTGCTRTIRFGAQGDREVRASTQDREGRAGSGVLSVFVQPPPDNPYPRISSAGVYSRDSLFISGTFAGCTDNLVASNAVIDLRQIGCKFGIFGPDLSRYLGKVVVENPANEALTYDWTYSTYFPTAVTPSRTLTTRGGASFDLLPFVFGALNEPYRCTVDVRVNAPEASRTKTQRVWSGRCINIEDAPR